MGIAVGGMGMSLTDFCCMTPTAFDKVIEAHTKRREAETHDGWEQTRALAFVLLQPYIGKGSGLTPMDIMPMPWDNHHQQTKEIDPAEQRERMKQIAEMLGDEMI